MDRMPHAWPAMAAWEPPKENSVDALQHGMEFSDGVEFDLKLSSDGDFVIFHDELLPGTGPRGERCIEMLGTDEIRSRGVATFDELLSNGTFTEAWQSGGKTANIEFKMPHPIARIKPDEHLRSMMGLIEQKLGELDLPDRSTLVYSFSPRIGPVAKSCGFEMPITRLMPHLRPWGFWKVKRAVGMPHFARTSVPALIRYLRRNEMPVMGMALEFLNGWTRWINPGPPVGLHGRGLERFNKARAGMGAFVWPAPLELEDALIGAGCSLVSDHINPDIVSLPDGSPRWPRPASQPLDEEWGGRLESAADKERADLIDEASSSLPTWAELGEGRRGEIVSEQGRRLLWSGSEDKWVAEAEGGLPWGSPRIMGHRGAGKTHGW